MALARSAGRVFAIFILALIDRPHQIAPALADEYRKRVPRDCMSTSFVIAADWNTKSTIQARKSLRRISRKPSQFIAIANDGVLPPASRAAIV